MSGLVLTRRAHETINIGPEENPELITIEVLGFKGNQVRLLINAPKDLVINREEITRAIIGEKLMLARAKV